MEADSKEAHALIERDELRGEVEHLRWILHRTREWMNSAGWKGGIVDEIEAVLGSETMGDATPPAKCFRVHVIGQKCAVCEHVAEWNFKP